MDSVSQEKSPSNNRKIAAIKFWRFTMHQAVVLDGSALDALVLQQNTRPLPLKQRRSRYACTRSIQARSAPRSWPRWSANQSRSGPSGWSRQSDDPGGCDPSPHASRDHRRDVRCRSRPHTRRGGQTPTDGTGRSAGGGGSWPGSIPAALHPQIRETVRVVQLTICGQSGVGGDAGPGKSRFTSLGGHDRGRSRPSVG